MTTPSSSSSFREGERLSCLESTPAHCNSVRVHADDHRLYAFSLSHYLDSVVEANPHRGPGDPPERLALRFATGEIVVLGSGLDRVEEALSEGRLRGMKVIEARLASQLRHPPVILSLSVNQNPEV